MYGTNDKCFYLKQGYTILSIGSRNHVLNTVRAFLINMDVEKARRVFVGMDSTGFKMTHASQYNTKPTRFRRKYVKLSIGADVLQQIICTIKIRRAPT